MVNSHSATAWNLVIVLLRFFYSGFATSLMGQCDRDRPKVMFTKHAHRFGDQFQRAREVFLKRAGASCLCSLRVRLLTPPAWVLHSFCFSIGSAEAAPSGFCRKTSTKKTQTLNDSNFRFCETQPCHLFGLNGTLLLLFVVEIDVTGQIR